ncbi:TPA: DUF551 domain-containing protein [Klebsiella pneumoniae]|nr:DUF551 domain-containing protein [Klebsiella pneumoniae]
MTSKLTRERLLEIAEDGFLKHGESKELASMALAVLDSEPVAEVLSNRPGNDTSIVDVALPVGTQLYRHAQPAPEYPETLPCPVLLEPGLRFGKGIKTSTMLAALSRRAVYESDLAALSPEERAEFQAGIEDVKALIAQPVPVAPICTCPSGDGSLRWPCPVHPGNSPTQSNCCQAQNHVSPEQNGDTPAQSQGWIPLSEQMPPSRHEVLVGRWWGENPRWCCKWATYIPGHPDAQSSGWLIPGASWTPTHWMPLPAAPQEVNRE